MSVYLTKIKSVSNK